MPIYMDSHNAPGVTARDIAEAHYRDVGIEKEFQCRCMTYWFDEGEGNVFCLIEAPTKEAVIQMHSQAHGLVPNEIIEVDQALVQSFLGRIKDPEKKSSTQVLNIFTDRAYRVAVIVKIIDGKLLRLQLDDDSADKILLRLNDVVVSKLRCFEGNRVEWEQDDLLFSFTSAHNAMNFAKEVYDETADDANMLQLRICIDGGQPVTKNENLFGDTLTIVQALSWLTPAKTVSMTQAIRDQVNHLLVNSGLPIRSLVPIEQDFLLALMRILQEFWNDPEFDNPQFCEAMSMSKPQLYRKSISVTGMSPNNLLRDYRLNQALKLLKKQSRNITETTFDTGFTTPSYFAKCFLKKFGIHPQTYLKE